MIAPIVGQISLLKWNYAQQSYCIWYFQQIFKVGPPADETRTGKVKEMMNQWTIAFENRMRNWLRQGIAPQRLALTLALGFAIGCLPVLGIPTAVCLALAVALRLNLPAIQAANYAAMPVQLALVLPFVRLGGRIFGAPPVPPLSTALHGAPLALVLTSGSLALHALGAWLVFAAPAVVLLTLLLTLVLRRIPVLAPQAGD